MHEMEDLWGLEQDVGGTEVFMGAGRTDLYRANAFRVAGLPVDVPVREIFRQADEVDKMDTLGCCVRCPAGPLPLEPLPDVSSLRLAMERLSNPRRRIVDEFFWFWPPKWGQVFSDEALQALGQGDLPGAVEVWTRDADSDRRDSISIHNLAVFSHAMALDMEQAALSKPLSEKQRAVLDNQWKQAFKRWKALLGRQDFWDKLAARIRMLEGPCLNAGTAERMRAALPVTILSVNARLVVCAAERGDTAEVGRHRRMMQETGFEESIVDESFRLALRPIRQKISALCRSAESEVESDPEQGVRIAAQLAEDTQPLLAVLDMVLPEGNPVRESVHSEVAARMWECQNALDRRGEERQRIAESHDFAPPVVVEERTEDAGGPVEIQEHSLYDSAEKEVAEGVAESAEESEAPPESHDSAPPVVRGKMESTGMPIEIREYPPPVTMGEKSEAVDEASETRDSAPSPGLSKSDSPSLETAAKPGQRQEELATCWFCGNNPSDESTVAAMAHAGLNVPRCSVCKSAHTRVRFFRAAGSLVAGIGIGSYLYATDVAGLVTALFMVGASMVIGAGLGHGLGLLTVPRGTKPESAGMEFHGSHRRSVRNG